MGNEVVVIIVNYKQNQYTIECINSLLKSEFQDFSIILINNEADETNYNAFDSFINGENKLHIHNSKENLGYVGGINLGLKLAEQLNPFYILIMNNDTIIDKAAITELVKTAKSYDNKAIVSGKVYHYDEPEKLQQVGFKIDHKNSLKYRVLGLNETDIGQYETVTEMDLLDDVFWLFPIELYKNIGGYNSYFWFNAEQADFALRAKKQDYKLVFTPKAKIKHKGSASIGGRIDNPKLTYWQTQSSLILRFLHLNFKWFTLFYLSLLFSTLYGFFKAFIGKLKGRKQMFKGPSAKFLAIYYFNKWVFLRNKNTGYNPFQC